jgi:hypothetical protein
MPKLRAVKPREIIRFLRGTNGGQDVKKTRKRMKNKKKRKYIQSETIGVTTKVQWGKRGGPVRIVVLIPREHLAKRLAK